MQCPTCKQELDDTIRFCPNDGTPLTETSAQRTAATPSSTGRTCERPASKEIALPTVIGGRYRLNEARGGGGMAKVYRGTDLTLEREVAVKLINPELRSDTEFDARFQREARVASQLADPHIVVVHDFGIDPEHGPFLVMEYLQGQSLREHLVASGPLPLKAGLQLSAQLMLALIHAHNKGIVHRDIKPDNIFLLNVSGVKLHVRVLDFGIARILRRDDTTARNAMLTIPGSVLGTPRYMAPEQLAGQPVDARADLYSAALVVHESLTGVLPSIGGKRLCELCPEASPALQELLEQCLRPEPADRPPTAVEVYLRLQELGKASGVLLLPPGAMDRLVAARQSNQPTVAYTPPEEKFLSRRRLLIAGGAAAGLVGLGALGKVLFFPSKPPAPSDGETLMGIKIGDKKADVEDRLTLAHVHFGDPWKVPKTKAIFGSLLSPKDLALPNEAEDLKVLEVRYTQDEKVCVLLHDNRVRAVVVRERSAYTGRGLRVMSDVSKLFEWYPESAETVSVKGGTGKGSTEVRRYDSLGIDFEIAHPKGARANVTAIALYPPVKE
jgi:serine/threonine protein kinase